MNRKTNTFAFLVEVDADLDGKPMAEEVFSMLEQYLAMAKQREAGDHAHEVFVSSGGSKLTVLAAARNAVSIPYNEPGNNPE